MNWGLLWYEQPNPKRSLADKIIAADARYRKKFRVVPTECQVNPTTLGKDYPRKVGIVQIIPANNVLKDHFWIGVGDGQN